MQIGPIVHDECMLHVQTIYLRASCYAVTSGYNTEPFIFLCLLRPLLINLCNRGMAHPFLINIFTALKGFQFSFLIAITAAGVVTLGGPKKSPRTSSIVQITCSFCPLRSASVF